MIKTGIGVTLKEIIDKKGLNVNQLATKIGASPMTIYNIIKRDNSKVDLTILSKICQELDITMEELIPGYMTPEEKAAAIEIAEALKPTQEELSKMWDNAITSKAEKMNNNGKSETVQYMDYLLTQPQYKKEDK